MSDTTSTFKALYGNRPLHALVVVSCLAMTGYVVGTLGTSALMNPEVWWNSILVWFLGAAIVHDLVLFPAYALADRLLQAALGGRRGGRPDRSSPLVPPLNYVRVPALGTGLLFLLFFPGIIEQGASTYVRATGQTQEPFLERWLLCAALLFASSALLYAVRLARTKRRASRSAVRARD